MLAAALVTFSCATLPHQPTYAAPGSFEQAVADYSAGHYSRALSEFQSCKTSFPSNTMVHYYLALCHQGLNHVDEAKSEYQWVMANGDSRLKAVAAKGFAQLSNARTSVAYAPTSSAAQPAASSKLKKIIEFYADW